METRTNRAGKYVNEENFAKSFEYGWKPVSDFAMKKKKNVYFEVEKRYQFATTDYDIFYVPPAYCPFTATKLLSSTFFKSIGTQFYRRARFSRAYWHDAAKHSKMFKYQIFYKLLVKHPVSIKISITWCIIIVAKNLSHLKSEWFGQKWALSTLCASLSIGIYPGMPLLLNEKDGLKDLITESQCKCKVVKLKRCENIWVDIEVTFLQAKQVEWCFIFCYCYVNVNQLVWNETGRKSIKIRMNIVNALEKHISISFLPKQILIK